MSCVPINEPINSGQERDRYIIQDTTATSIGRDKTTKDKEQRHFFTTTVSNRRAIVSSVSTQFVFVAAQQS